MRSLLTTIFFAVTAFLPTMLFATTSTPISSNTHELYPDYSQTRRQAEKLAIDLLDDYDGAGLGVVLVDNKRVVWCEGFGYADKEKNIDADCNTVFRLGTASSVFTILAALQLAEKNKLDIKAPVKSYFPDLKIQSRFENTRVMTLHSLMSHHAGLPAGIQYGKWSSAPKKYVEIFAQLKNARRVLPPDKIFTRSDIAMNILGEIISRRSRQAFSEYMTDKIFSPTGMRSSGFELASYFSRRLASGYRLGKKQSFYYDRDVPASGLFSSPADIGLFLSELLSGNRLLKRTLVQSMWQPQNNDVQLDLDMPVGLGWVLGAFGMDGLGPVAHYSGDSLFQRCQIVLLPKLKLAVAVMANSWKSREMVDSLARNILLLAIEDKFGSRPDLTVIPKKKFSEAEIEQNSAEMIGQYATWSGLISIYKKSNKLKLDMGSRTLFLLPWNKRWFKMQYRLFGFIPINIPRLNHILLSTKNINGRQIMVANYRGSNFVYGEKLTKKKLPEKWLQRLGRYQVVKQDEVMKIEQLSLQLKNKNLILKYDIPGILEDSLQTPLQILSDTTAIVAGLGQGLGDALIFKEGRDGLTHIWMSGYEVIRTGR